MTAKKETENINLPENFSLYSLDVNDKIEKKPNGTKELKYLSWSWAYAEARKKYPDIAYSIFRDDNGRPYIYEEGLGYMVFTTVYHDGLEYDMWLPVMDSRNNAMKKEPYQYKTKYGVQTVEAASMTDINKTIMRCLVKNLAVACGVGLYIYSNEDIPEGAAIPAEPIKNRPVIEPPEPPAQKCMKCGRTIEAGGGMTSAEVATARMNKYGLAVCGKCAEVLRKAQQNKEQAEQNAINEAFEAMTGGSNNEG